MDFIPGQERVCACRIWSGSREADSGKKPRVPSQNPNPSNPEGFGTLASFNLLGVYSGAARRGWPPAGLGPFLPSLVRWRYQVYSEEGADNVI